VDIGNSGGFINQIFNSSRFMSLVIGIALIFAGFEAAQQFCKESFVSGALGMGRGFAKKVAMAPAAAGAYLGAKAARKAGGLALAGGKIVGGELKGLAAKPLGSRAEILRKLQRSKVGKAIPFAAPALARAAAGYEAAEAKKVGETRDALKGLERDDKIKMLRGFIDKPPKTEYGKRQYAALTSEAYGDPKMMKELEKTGDMTKLHTAFGAETKKRLAGDETYKKNFDNFEKARPDIFASGTSDDQKRTELRSRIKSKEDVSALSADAVLDPLVQERLKEMTWTVRGKGGNEKTVNAFDQIEKGQFRDDMKRALQLGRTGLYEDAKGMDQSRLDRLGEKRVAEDFKAIPEAVTVTQREDEEDADFRIRETREKQNNQEGRIKAAIAANPAFADMVRTSGEEIFVKFRNSAVEREALANAMGVGGGTVDGGKLR
jgi:hypothetical protein